METNTNVNPNMVTNVNPNMVTNVNPNMVTNVNRCEICNKKITLTTTICKCKRNLCKYCVLPQIHNCQFDYKLQQKLILEKNLPQIHTQKINKI
jgi:predicted nucleic acid binding AN1-type Zn finger protein